MQKLDEGFPLAVRLGRKQLMLIKNKKSAVKAFLNKCPHAGAKLSNGWINHAGQLVCPAHRFVFDLETGRSCDGEGLCLNEMKVNLEGRLLR